ncbi:MAG: class I SAM-dependent methyltransferase [Gammaproteobacteria bacterium]|nr:class I SAM-dependent methyltransferase [Gammaproteobacteria bacterium]MCP5138059.1 class I SAM-dependent methyltransferase [Gammaproteobacteria bacterium]
MQRIPEPELMNDPAQAQAYAEADFSEPHDAFVATYREHFPETRGQVLDLGCGPADVTLRFARAHPDCTVLGIDAAEQMLQLGRHACHRAGLSDRIELQIAHLPHTPLPHEAYAAIISNSLLHHLNDPMTLWNTVAEHAHHGTQVFVMDLLRPDSPEAARALVDTHAANEPDVLRHDFYHSLRAAYREDEVEAQLRAAGLGVLRVEIISDRHFIVYGRVA